MKKQWGCLLLAVCLLPLCSLSRADTADVFAGAKWSWTDTRENNAWVYLQKTFSLAEAPDTSKAFIAAAGTAQALEVTLPEGVTAQVRLPGGGTQTVSGAGTHVVSAE